MAVRRFASCWRWATIAASFRTAQRSILLADFLERAACRTLETSQAVLSLISRLIAAGAATWQRLSSGAPLPRRGGNTLGRVAQLAEHSTLNRQVEGSIPSASTIVSTML